MTFTVKDYLQMLKIQTIATRIIPYFVKQLCNVSVPLQATTTLLFAIFSAQVKNTFHKLNVHAGKYSVRSV